MTYVICEPCIDVKDNACIDVCPVDCIHPHPTDAPDEYEEVNQLLLTLKNASIVACVNQNVLLKRSLWKKMSLKNGNISHKSMQITSYNIKWEQTGCLLKSYAMCL